MSSYDIVVPTIGRASLPRLLTSLAEADGPVPEHVYLVDDRRDRSRPLLGPAIAEVALHRIKVITGRAAGPAAARNDGWRATGAEWVAFLDDDVEVPPDWRFRLASDLDGLANDVGASQGRIRVPLAPDRRATDWERNVGGLERARWATADMAYRRRVLAAVGGFDERFPRAYREDADLGLRVTGAGWRIVDGERQVTHPVGPAPWSVGVAKQRGNADDALMDRIHGPGWRDRAAAPPGRRRVHVTTTAAAVAGGLGLLARRRTLATVGLGTAVALTAELAARRIAPGPRTVREVSGLLASSAALPPAATVRWVAGVVRARRLAPRSQRPRRVDAVLFDRDGTLVHDVAYNGDPQRVQPVAGARAALDRLRAEGVAVGIVSNQSGVARGLLLPSDVEAVNARVAQLLGPFGVIAWCPHGPDGGCGCRKPAPGLITEAAARLGTHPSRCAVVGDIGADVAAAAAAGARGILVPTPITRTDEIDHADEVVADLFTAVDRLLADRGKGHPGAHRCPRTRNLVDATHRGTVNR